MSSIFSKLMSLLPKRFSAELRQTFASLADRDYRTYAIGQMLSLCGTQLQNVALSWLVYRLTNSATMLGLVSFAGSLPLILFVYYGGITADRSDRRKLIIATQYLAMTQAIVLAWLTITNHVTVTWVLGLSAFVGLVSAFENPARQVFVPELVEEDQLVNAIGVNSAMFNLSRMMGPVLAGFAIGSMGEGTCFALNAVSYLAALVTLYMVRAKPKKKPGAAPAIKQQAPGIEANHPQNILAIMTANKRVRDVLALAVVTSLFGFQYGVLMPVIVKEALHGDATLLGFLSGASAVGALFGSLSVARGGSERLTGHTIGFASLGLSLAVVILAMSHTVALSMLGATFAGYSLTVQAGSTNSLIQTSIDSAVRGRVMGLYSMAMYGFTPLAALLTGYLAEIYGITPSLLTCAGFLAVAALFYLRQSSQDPKPSS